MLFICGLLSAAASALELPISAEQASLYSTNNTDNKSVKRDKSQALAQIKQDPTRPASVIVQQLSPELTPNPAFKLTAIFSRNEQQYAVVNGNVVQMGDAIADMHVTDITSTQLIMQNKSASNDEMVLALSTAQNVKNQVNR